MQKINDGGPAFPETGARGKAAGGEGMTLRDYFAAKAMQGILASDADPTYANLAKSAYRTADAMLAAREQTEE